MVRKKKRMSAAQRRAQLIDVGRGVFAEHGYNAASVEEIARSAKVSKPIVYEHFGGKEGLYAVIIDREMDALVERVTARISEGTPRARFEGAIVAFLTYVQEEPDGFSVLTRDAPMTMTGHGMPSVISDLGERVGSIFEQAFADAGLDTKTSPIYAHALIGMVTLVGQWWKETQDLPLKTVAGHLAALGWMGLRHLPKKPDRIG